FTCRPHGTLTLITTGLSWDGYRLTHTLTLTLQSSQLVTASDVENPHEAQEAETASDIRDYSSLYKVCEGVDCIFHTASSGMSGPEQLRKEQVESVNVGGTNNIINVCQERSIPRLVYTSTINVVFAGEPIEEGDEASVPCITKQTRLECGGLLRTCILRPCGIYGPEERRHLHRVNVERRLFSFRFGDPQARMNWVHVDNLVLAHTLAAEALALQRSCVASGQAYFINDGVSVNLFEWLTPLVTVSHTFKIDKARRELGYSPKAYSLVDSVDQYLKSRRPRSRSALFRVSWTSRLPRHLLVMLLLGLSLLLLMLFCTVSPNDTIKST
uniref:Short chain dehydrogenase/reductase family 42E, member 2 n=1 Tax=Cyclopterus lumpus TaxID=8103 RepID=A0A8C2ZF70_CYCLU